MPAACPVQSDGTGQEKESGMSTIESLLTRGIEAFGAARYDEARGLYAEVLRRDPSHGIANYHTGLIAGLAGDHDRAIEHIRRGIAGNVPEPKAHYNLGTLLHQRGRYNEARQAYLRTLTLMPGYVNALSNLADVEYKFGNLGRAEEYARKAVSLAPAFFMAHNNLGNILKDQGRYTESAESYRQAMQHRPDYAPANSNLLLSLGYDMRIDPAIYFDEHKKYGERFSCEPVAGNAVDKSPDRRLRIGYVSP
ncbi:MAG: tetratricopeptide repeat protein, partial [Chitinivibrionales bacterium]|nr:tetratricopeptide repeat protein [Chitinivibrionales bacterium]MBD3396914.1 tetratricopeptide repeat protein [Chitinivibrionales bacterium]